MRSRRRLPLEQLAPYLLPLPDPVVPLDWTAVFGTGHPVELEVGFGKGLFLLNAAQACPTTNFVGIEVVRKYQLLAATRMALRGLTNVRLIHGDARLILRDAVAPDSLQAVHVYFPDPWWKKRHHKRRVFTAEFATQCERVIRPNGKLNIATDVEESFHNMTAQLAEHTRLISLPPPEPKDPAHDLDYLTNFERKFRKQGKAIWRAVYEKPPTPHSTS